MFTSVCLLIAFFVTPSFAAVQKASAQELASLYGLATSTSFAFPAATQDSSSTQSLIVSQWSLGKGRIQDNPEDLSFVNDPFPNNPIPNSPPRTNETGPVLQVTYPAGSFSHNTGGSQWYNLWNSTDGSPFLTMIASYEVAFDSGFNWVLGGKLPGLRGGLNSSGCSGGSRSDGLSCFSTRVMWRRNGAGEAYAYIPPSNKLCYQNGIQCNSDFGISIQRGSFNFVSGQWNRITILVRMNEPVDIANGNIQLFYNDFLALSQAGLQIRSSPSVSINGFYFSTFFGGSDSSWATPNTTHTYFRNMQLWGSKAPSNLTGSGISGAHRAVALDLSIQVIIWALCCIFGGFWAQLF